MSSANEPHPDGPKPEGAVAADAAPSDGARPVDAAPGASPDASQEVAPGVGPGAGASPKGGAESAALGEPGPRPSLLLLVGVAGTSLAADLLSKGWAYSALSGWDGKRMSPKRVEVINGFMAFLFAQNPGGAWSFLRSWSDGVRRPFFLFVSSAAIVFIVSIYRRLLPSQRTLALGLSFALGGAMGNLVDRIRYGWVIDFIAVYVKRDGREIHWPTFNVADIAIVVGVLLMSKDLLFPAQAGLPAQAPAAAGARAPEPPAPPSSPASEAPGGADVARGGPVD